MKLTKKLLSLFLITLMLLSVLASVSYAATTYTVTLNCGPGGKGSSVRLTKTKGVDLDLSNYSTTLMLWWNTGGSSNSSTAIQPSDGVLNQRAFIEWNTAVNSTTWRGTGTSYTTKYTADQSTTLYAVWGYPIIYNADGGYFPDTGTSQYPLYVAGYDGSNFQNPKTLYGNFGIPDGNHGTSAPVKTGCRMDTVNGNPAYLLLYNNMSICTTETAAQNLTIPPTGGNLAWSQFHTTTTNYQWFNGDGQTYTYAPEFYIAWEPSVTYDANGGTGSSYSEYFNYDYDGGSLYYYDQYTVLAPTNSHLNIQRSGYTFTGWNTKADGSGTSYSAGSVIPSQHANSDPITLYAQWRSTSTTYDIQYRQNRNGTGTPYTVQKIHNVNYTITGNTAFTAPSRTLNFNANGGSVAEPSRTGYVDFVCWNTQRNGSGTSYYEGDIYTANANLTVYAQWAQGYTFNNLPTATRSGYRFMGWAASSSATAADYPAGGSYTVSTSDISANGKTYSETIYAVWKPEYTVSFDAGNGGTVIGGSSYGIIQGESYTEATGGTIPTASKTGMIFMGWHNAKYNYTLSPGDTWAISENATFDAVFVPSVNLISKNIVSYNPSLTAIRVKFAIDNNANYQSAHAVEIGAIVGKTSAGALTLNTDGSFVTSGGKSKIVMYSAGTQVGNIARATEDEITFTLRLINIKNRDATYNFVGYAIYEDDYGNRKVVYTSQYSNLSYNGVMALYNQ